jgi:hypothetical protein
MSEDDRMRYDPSRAKALAGAFAAVSERVAKAANGRNVFPHLPPPPSEPLKEKLMGCIGTCGRSLEAEASF